MDSFSSEAFDSRIQGRFVKARLDPSGPQPNEYASKTITPIENPSAQIAEEPAGGTQRAPSAEEFN